MLIVCRFQPVEWETATEDNCSAEPTEVHTCTTACQCVCVQMNITVCCSILGDSIYGDVQVFLPSSISI